MDLTPTKNRTEELLRQAADTCVGALELTADYWQSIALLAALNVTTSKRGEEFEHIVLTETYRLAGPQNAVNVDIRSASLRDGTDTLAAAHRLSWNPECFNGARLAREFLLRNEVRWNALQDKLEGMRREQAALIDRHEVGFANGWQSDPVLVATRSELLHMLPTWRETNVALLQCAALRARSAEHPTIARLLALVDTSPATV